MKKQVLACAMVLPLALLANRTLAVELTPEEQLGKALYEDTSFSYNQLQSCKSCHDPAAGFADPAHTAVSTGADGVSKGGRNGPTAAYAGLSPVRYSIKQGGDYFGGLFWDSRADGSLLGDPLAEQAQGPPLNPVEMAMVDKDAIVTVIADSYTDEFLEVYAFSSFEDIDQTYNLFAKAIAAYERSPEVMKFSSRYDQNQLSQHELRGHGLVKKYCSSCHLMDNTTGYGAAFTSFGYANIGLPENPLVVGDEGDLGLGAVVNKARENGKFKIPTLRNVAMTAPYGHNGYFTTLQEMVTFMNSRDSMGLEADVQQNISKAVGNLGLTASQVDSIVAFLEALTDQ